MRTLFIDFRRRVLIPAMVAAVGLAAHGANAQVSALVGQWKVVSVDNVHPDGWKEFFGAHPRGTLTFDSDGHYVMVVLLPGQPKVALGDEGKGTETQRQQDAQLPTYTHSGTYTVSDDGKSLTFHVEHANLPDQEGSEFTRPFQLRGDELTYITPTTDTKEPGEVRWVRVR
jgi:Lipocalin-like domain